MFRPPRIAEALRRREGLASGRDLTAYRLFHGDAEGCPGLAVDRFGGLVVIHADAWELFDEWLPTLEEELTDYDSAYVKIHPRGANRLRAEEVRRLAPDEPIWGNPVEELEALEHGIRYLVRPDAGLSVGLFLDMRDVREWLRQNTAQRTVLNLFAYTCSFGVAATLGAASRVVNLDVSRPYLEWGKANYALNDLPTDDRDFIYGDALDWLRRFARRGERFDVVIIDPPSFSSTPFSVVRDYSRLVAHAAQVVAAAGMLVAATNHAGTTDDTFDDWLDRGLTDAGRDGRLLQSWHEPTVDFPVPTGRPPYLKVRALVLD